MEESSRGKRRPSTPEERARAAELRAQGLSYSAIGLELGRTHSVISRWLDPAAAEASREGARRYRVENHEAVRDYTRRWRAENPEKCRDYARRWRAENREKCREASRRWRAKNLESCRERGRRYMAANREADYERGRRWRRKNLEACRERHRRRHALKRNGRRRALVPLTREAHLQRFALFGNRCAYCGAADRLTVDHVLALHPEKGGGLDEPGNIVPACGRCNSSKNARPVEAWYRSQPFFTEARWARIVRNCPTATGQMPLALAA